MKKLSMAGLALIGAFALSACEEGPAEKAGKQIDETGERIQESVDRATGQETTMERAQRRTEDALESARDNVSEAYDHAKEEVKEGWEHTRDATSETYDRAKESVQEGYQDAKDSVNNALERNSNK